MKNISSQLFNLHQQFSIPFVKRTFGSAAPVEKRIAAIELHKYIIGSIGIFSLFALSFAVAVHRCERSPQVVRDRAIQMQSGSISP